MNFQQFCQDFRIPMAPRGHTHSRAEWINITCPFCSGHFGYHLGYSKAGDFFSCYRCGWHSKSATIESLAHVGSIEARELIRLYVGKPQTEREEIIIHPNQTILPSGTGPMTEHHRKYLRGRNFNPDNLERIWRLMGTDHTGNFRFRVIAPIIFRNQLVSYQGRDITDHQFARYKTCPVEQEAMPHKHVLYGWDQVPPQVMSCIVVEGITGVWRFGPGSLATFGVNYSMSQVRLLVNRFERIFILFDPDEAGEKAEKFTNDLSIMGRKTTQLEISLPDFDSGNLPQEMADQIMKEILK